jgi:hypothetical protein
MARGYILPDPSLFVAIALAMVGVVLYAELRRARAAVPRCAECRLDMERDTTELDPFGIERSHPFAGHEPLGGALATIFRCTRVMQ